MKVRYTHLEQPEITREIVAEETRLEVLGEWSLTLSTIESELLTAINSESLSDESATFRKASKLGYIRIAKNWVNDRIGALGGDVPDTAYGAKLRRLKHQVTCASQQIEKKNKEIARLKERLGEAEDV